MTAIFVPAQAQPRIEPSQYMRNELAVTPYAQNVLAGGANQVLLQRTKELFSSPGQVSSILTSVATRERWRFAGHTSPYETRLVFSVLVARPNASGAAAARLEVFNAAGTVSLGVVDLPYGGTAVNDTPNELIELMGTLAIAADTEITAVISDVTKGRLVQATVYEWALDPDTANGYFAPNAGSGSPILSGQRSAIATAMTSVWKHGAAAVVSFPGDAVTINNVEKNLVDASSTTITTHTPGVTLDMRYKNRKSKTTVPVRMRVYGHANFAGQGYVSLKNAAGAVVLSIVGFGTADAWHEVDGFLPATLAKYDLVAAGTGGTSGTLATCPIGSDLGLGNMVLAADGIGAWGNILTITVDSPDVSTTTLADGPWDYTLQLRGVGDDSATVESVINGAAATIVVHASDSNPSNHWDGISATGGPFAFSGGTDDSTGTITVKAVSIFELEV